jgi:hypothetical protein
MYTETMMLIKALLVIGLNELQVLEKAKRSSVAGNALAGQQAVTPALLQHADELIRKDRRITTRKLVTELSVSK